MVNRWYFFFLLLTFYCKNCQNTILTGIIYIYFFSLQFQEDLDRTAQVWNCHRIRRSRTNDLQQGRPMLMYSLPALYGANDCIKGVNQDAIRLCEAECMRKGNVSCGEILHRLCNLIMEEKGWNMPENPHDMCDLYISLRQEIILQL